MPRRILLIVLAVVFGLPACLILIEHLRGRFQLKAAISDLARRGESLEINTFKPPESVDGVNAIHSLFAAKAQLSMTPGDDSPAALRIVGPARAIPGSLLDPWNLSARATNTWSQLDEWTRENARELADARAALAATYCQPVVDYSKGFEADFSHLATLKGLSVNLSAATAAAIHRGDAEAVIENLRALHRVAEAMALQPLLIDQLVRLACADAATYRAWDALHGQTWTETQLAGMQSALPPIDLAGGTTLSFQGERAICHNTIHLARAKDLAGFLDFDEFPLPGETFAQFVFPLWKFALSDQTHAHYLGFMQRLVDAARETSRQRSLASYSEAEQMVVELEAAESRYQRLRTIYARSVGPAVVAVMRKALRSETLRGMARADFALRRFQLRHGRLPHALQELVPEFLDSVPVDCMDGQPLRYSRDGDANFVLWSVGENLRDDGGDATLSSDEPSLMSLLEAPDIVWPRPASRAEIAQWHEARLKKVSRETRNRSQPRPFSPDLYERYGLTPPPSTNPPVTNN
jgi:hypothetical protein